MFDLEFYGTEETVTTFSEAIPSFSEVEASGKELSLETPEAFPAPEESHSGTAAPSAKREKASKKRRLLLAQLVSAAAVVTVGSVAVSGALLPRAPTYVSTEVVAYRSNFTEDGSALDSPYASPEYDVAFSFLPNDAVPLSVMIVGSSYYESPDGTREEETEIAAYYAAEEMPANDGTLSAVYTVTEPAKTYEMQAIFSYVEEKDKDNLENAVIKEVESEIFYARIPSIRSFADPAAYRLQAVWEGERLLLTLDYAIPPAGAFELRMTSLVLEAGGESFLFGGDGEAPIPISEDGRLCVTVELTDTPPVGESIPIFAALMSECYFQGEKTEFVDECGMEAQLRIPEMP